VIAAIAHKHTKVAPESPGGSGFPRKGLASNRFPGERHAVEFADRIELPFPSRTVEWLIYRSRRLPPSKARTLRFWASPAAAWPRTVTAQRPSKVYRIGSLVISAPIANSPFDAALIRGLAQHGYALDKNFTFEHRGAEMQIDRLARWPIGTRERVWLDVL